MVLQRGALWSMASWHMGARCVRRGRPVVARLCLDAFSGVLPWQDSAAVRSRAAIRGNFFASCISEGASDGKIASSRQDSRAMHPKTGWLWQDMRAMHPKTGWLWQDMRAMHPKCPANRRWRIHRAKILPGRGTFRCTGPSNHARRANLAIRRRRSALAPAIPVPPTSAKPPERPQPQRRRTARNSASRPQPRRRPHGSAPPTAFAVPAAATPQTLPHPTAPRH